MPQHFLLSWSLPPITSKLLTILEGLEQILAETGTLGFLIRALSQVPKDEEAARIGLKIIAAMGVDDQVRSFFVKSQRLVALVKEVMTCHPSAAIVQQDVMRAIINLTFRSKQAKHHFLVSHKILPLVLNGLSMNSPSLVFLAISALRNLVTVGLLFFVFFCF